MDIDDSPAEGAEATVEEDQQAEGNVAHLNRLNCNDTEDSLSVPTVPDEFRAVPIEVPERPCQGTTAFFVFSSVHREMVTKELRGSDPSNKVTIGQIGKRMGVLWKGCSDEVKARYAEMAKENKANAPTCAPDEAEDSATQTAGLPCAVVKRIIMLDEDQKRIAADAVDLAAKAAELFLKTVVGKAKSEAQGAARSTITSHDVETVLRRWKPTGWAASPFQEIENSQTQQIVPVQSKSMLEAAKGTRDIASMFARQQPS